MSFSAGVYTLPGPALNTGEIVSATENNSFRNDVATAFNLTFLRNGTSTATANLPMGGYKLTGLGVATTSGDALSYGQAAVVSSLTNSALTSGRVPFASTGGLLVDTSGFTFDGTTLTAGGFSGPHNGTVGATTPNTGAFTTLTTSSTITVNGGTANGVAYLNGSKVLTTGSALTFDGTNLTSSQFNSATTTATSLTVGAARFSGTSGAILLDDNSQKRISWNDGGGNFAIRSGNYYNGSALVYVKSASDSNGGAATITLTSDGSDGSISLNAAAIGTPGATVTYGNSFTVSPTTASLTLTSFTLNGNQVLHAGNYNSYSPTLTGGGASGTWGISVTGNAGTATTATNQSGGTVSATTGAFSSTVSFAGGSSVSSTGDILARRSSGTTGIVYFVDGTKYLFYDGIGFTLNGGALTVNSSVNATGLVRTGDGSAGEKQLVMHNNVAYTYWSINSSGNSVLYDSTAAQLRCQYDRSGGNWYFYCSGTERLRLANNGVIYAGGYNTGGANVGGVIATTGYNCKPGQSGALGGNMFNINWTGTPQLWIDTTNVGTFAFTSDYRVKKNVTTQAEPALDRVMQLRPVTYEFADYGTLFKADGVQREGFIAHEVQEVIPSGAEGAKDEEGRIQNLRVDAILAVAVKAIQELKTEVDLLKAELAAIKGA